MLYQLNLLSDRPTAESVGETILSFVAHALNEGLEDDDEATRVVGGLLSAWDCLSDVEAQDTDNTAHMMLLESDDWLPRYRKVYARVAKREWVPGDDTIPGIIPTSRAVPDWLVRDVAIMHAEHDTAVSKVLRQAAMDARGEP
jgi:hypothetical protein